MLNPTAHNSRILGEFKGGDGVELEIVDAFTVKETSITRPHECFLYTLKFLLN